MHLNDSLP